MVAEETFVRIIKIAKETEKEKRNWHGDRDRQWSDGRGRGLGEEGRGKREEGRGEREEEGK